MNLHLNEFKITDRKKETFYIEVKSTKSIIVRKLPIELQLQHAIAFITQFKLIAYVRNGKELDNNNKKEIFFLFHKVPLVQRGKNRFSFVIGAH